MNRADLVNRIADQIASARDHLGGIVGIMLDAEIAAGGVPYDPGPDWVPGVVVRRDAEVRLVAILAKQPGSGALKRLVARIQAEGLTPVIIEPTGLVMPAILKRWNWRRTVRGRGWERVEEWRPPPTDKAREGEATAGSEVRTTPVSADPESLELFG